VDVLARGTYGAVLALGEAIRALGYMSRVITDVDSKSILMRKSVYDEVIGVPRSILLQPVKFADWHGNAENRPPLTVISCYDPLGPAHCAALVRLGQANEAAALMRCFIKPVMRDCLAPLESREGTVPLDYFAIRTRGDLDAVLAGLRIGAESPWILKPAVGTSSELVSRRLESRAMVRDALDAALASKREWIGPTMFQGQEWSGAFVLEQYVDGREYSVEGIAGDQPMIVGICEKRGLEIVAGVRSEGANTSPIRDRGRARRIKEFVKQAIGLLGLRASAFHVELRWDERVDDPRILEVNPRLPGGLLCKVHRARTGVDLPREFVMRRLGVGGPTAKPRARRGVFADIPLPATRTGTYMGYLLPDVDPPKGARIDVLHSLEPGMPFEVNSCECYYAHAFVHADNYRNLEDVERYCAAIRPDVR
jgi:hypothetical protein